jgi:hypothetical protein
MSASAQSSYLMNGLVREDGTKRLHKHSNGFVPMLPDQFTSVVFNAECVFIIVLVIWISYLIRDYLKDKKKGIK